MYLGDKGAATHHLQRSFIWGKSVIKAAVIYNKPKIISLSLFSFVFFFPNFKFSLQQLTPQKSKKKCIY